MGGKTQLWIDFLWTLILHVFRSNATLKARCQILTDWQNDITEVISATHKKLNKLGSDKIMDTKDTVKDLVRVAVTCIIVD